MTNDKPDMSIERRQVRLQANSEATERWMRKLLRAATELKKLTEQRKRLLAKHGRKAKAAYKSLGDIPHVAGGGDEFNDDIPL
jgi:hypothetical protein